MERKRARSRTVRALTRSSRFDISARDGFRIHHLRAIPPQALLDVVRAHSVTLTAGGARVLKNAPKSALTRQTMTVDGEERSVIVKEYRVTGISARLKNCVRRPRAVAAWLAGNGLWVRRFEVAGALGLLLDGRGPFLGRSFMVMADAGDATRLDLVALRRFAGELDGPARRSKRDLVLATARLLRDLHAGDVYHSDLKAVNLFVREDGGPPAIVLADYDRVEFDGPVPERRRLKNLAQLSASVAICVTLSDRLRFFREYAGGDAETGGDWKRWFREVMRLCERKIVVRMDPIE